MGKKVPVALCAVLISIPLTAFSDTITRSDGSKVQGTILSSTESHVNIQVNDTSLIQIPHNEIETICFTAADVVELLSRESITCKIVRSVFPDLFVVTTGGLRKIPLVNLRSFFYNSTDSLCTLSLPPTGPEFKNKKASKPVQIGRKLSIGIALGSHWPPVNRWEENFMSTNFLTGYRAGLNVGYALTQFLSLGGGFEYSFYSFTNSGALESNLFTAYVHTNLELSQKLKSRPSVYGIVGTDVGLLYVHGTIFLYSYREIRPKEWSFALRPRVGAYFFFTPQLTIGADLGYFLAKSGTIEMPVEWLEDFAIGFNGIQLTTRLTYHIPID